MKKLCFSVVAAMLVSASVYAGGDMVSVEPVVETPVVAVDEGDFYVGMGLSAVSTRDAAVSLDIFDGKPGQDRLGNATFQLGYNFNPYMAVEGRFTTTFIKEDYVDMYGWSLFAKPQYPVTKVFKVYGFLGYGGVTMDGVNNGVVDVDDTGFQWGLGASYTVIDNVDLFFDYTSLAKDMDGTYGASATQADADAFTLGVSYNF